MLDPEHKIFIVHIASFFVTIFNSNPLNIDIYFSCRPQIAGLIAKKALIKVAVEYTDFADVFSLNLASKLPKHTGIDDYIIKLFNSQQPLYGIIHGLKPINLETLKVNIKTNLVKEFIKLSKSSARAPIFFDQKSDRFF